MSTILSLASRAALREAILDARAIERRVRLDGPAWAPALVAAREIIARIARHNQGDQTDDEEISRHEAGRVCPGGSEAPHSLVRLPDRESTAGF